MTLKLTPVALTPSVGIPSLSTGTMLSNSCQPSSKRKLSRASQRSFWLRPSKAEGVSFLEDKEGWHGRPLPKDLAEKALAELVLTEEQIALARSLKVKAPETIWEGEAPAEPLKEVEFPRYELGQQVATREAYGDGLVALGKG
jgi:hypothetical protein